MAPEVLDSGGYTYSADVYSLGVVIHEMVSLEQPYSRFPVALVRLLFKVIFVIFLAKGSQCFFFFFFFFLINHHLSTSPTPLYLIQVPVKIIEGEKPLTPDNLPEEWLPLIELSTKMMEKEPTERLTLSECLVELQAIEQG